LTTFAQTLSAELSPLNIPVTHLQLGTFDLSPFSPHRQALTIQSQRAETLKWDESARGAYGRNYVELTGKGSKVGRGSSLRELNNAVFDAMYRNQGGVVRVGMGSQIYGFVGRWVPRGLVGWMMGVRSVDGTFGRKGEGELRKGNLIENGSEHGSTGSSGGCGCGGAHSSGQHGQVRGFGDSEYISVYGERDEEGDPSSPRGSE
jgi:hypothetical protein